MTIKNLIRERIFGLKKCINCGVGLVYSRNKYCKRCSELRVLMYSSARLIFYHKKELLKAKKEYLKRRENPNNNLNSYVQKNMIKKIIKNI